MKSFSNSRLSLTDHVWQSLFAIALFLLIAQGCNRATSDAAGGEAAKSPGADRAPENKAPVEITIAEESIQKYGIKTETATMHVLTPTFIVPGEISFNLERLAHVGTPVTGRIADMKKHCGDEVQQNDDLLVIDSSELAAAQSDFSQKHSATEAATPAVRLARDRYDRSKQLYEHGGGISLSELQKREGEQLAAEATMQMAISAETAARNKLQLLGMDGKSIKRLEGGEKIDSKFVVHSPLKGIVVECSVTSGELVSPDKDSLMMIADLSKLWVLADVPSTRLHGIQVGGYARVRLSDGKTAIQGKVSYLPVRLDPTTRTGQVRIDVENPERALRDGMFAQVELPVERLTSDPDSVVGVPEEAILTIDGSPSIFVPVADKPGTFVRKTVVLGESANGITAILAGLKEGQSFVSSGTFILKAELGKSSIEE